MRICVLSEYFHPDNSGGTGPVMSGLVRHLKDNYPTLEIDVITSVNLFRGQSDAPPFHENWEEDGEAVSVIAVTGTAANISGIAGGIIVFGDPMAGDALGIVVQAAAFVMVIVASALMPAPLSSGRRAEAPAGSAALAAVS